jgi:hypothetical protein
MRLLACCLRGSVETGQLVIVIIFAGFSRPSLAAPPSTWRLFVIGRLDRLATLVA